MGLGVSIERHLKRFVFGTLAGRTTGDGVAPGRPELGAVRRILLVRPNFRLGNLVLATPALRVLADALPAARIDVLCGAPYAELLAADPSVHATIGVPRDLHRHPIELLRLVRRLRAVRYDLVVDAARGSSFLGAFFAWASGGRWRVASAACRYQAFFNVFVPQDPRSRHKVDLMLDLLRGLGFEAGRIDPHVTVGPADRERAAEVWRSHELDRYDHVVGIAIGARGAKRWPLAQIGEIARALRARDGTQVAVFAGPEDHARLAELRSALPAGIVVAPLAPIRVFAALLARCHVVVTPDSGPMHLAAAVGTPTVILVRAPQSAFYLPRDARHRPLAPPDGDVVPAVLRAVETALARPASPEHARTTGR